MDSAMIKKMFAHWADMMALNKDYLVRLDSVAGDGDLGLVMSDGFRAVTEAISMSEETDLGKLVFLAGKTLSKVAPSSMGTLLSMGFINAGKKLKDKTELDNEGIADLLESIAEGIMQIGKAKEGEKTFLDAILPAARSAREHIQLDTHELTTAAANAAEDGFHNATMMIAKHGRIAFRGENSKGIEDPGAAVAMLLVKGLSDIYKVKS